ncbi:MAG: hypothetical protein UU42_C0007G0016 [Candidatus Woesebacteria bacterium GW2011_GWA1_41_13b]|uniref:Uncharacterized protein n=1 Tax=Candidatus Woesebacteria bacterium GW2011_GWA1_41_13b TaxID=1618555 RepID=A0A0G0USR3_9BACT|nr:MAG: hypothetical protein UU42_C0007G0016 [Candidatus Woesebacteria bacterium GW2011_GWA1_41_13b]
MWRDPRRGNKSVSNPYRDPGMGDVIGWMFKGWGLLILLIVLAGSISIGLWAFGVGTADIFGRGEARKQIQSAEFRISAYQTFFNQCAGIQGLEKSLDASFEQLKTAETTADRARINQNIAGVQSAHGQAIAKYNGDARKDYTIGQFRDNDLPFQIPDNGYPEGGKTSCGSR